MSPQQLWGEPGAPADDIYALGATLYELLTGEPPFVRGHLQWQIEQREPENLAHRRAARGISAEVPEPWENTIAACLAKDPAQRPTSAGEILARVAEPRPRTSAVEPRQTEWWQAGARAKRFLAIFCASLWPSKAVGRWRTVSALTAILIGVAGWHLWPTTPASPVIVPATAETLLVHLPFAGDVRNSAIGDRARMVNQANLLPVRDRHGREDGAFHFSGLSRVELALASAMLPTSETPLTIAAWIRPMVDDEHGRTIVIGDASEGGAFSFMLSLHHRRLVFSCGPAGEEALATLSTATPIADDQWHHTAAVFDGRELAVFLDGREIARTRYAGKKAPAATQMPLRIGFGNNLDPWGFTGDLDEIRLYRRALGAGEIATLFKRESTPPETLPRFARTRGTYRDKGDLAAAAVTEFGAGATLADWDEIKRFHADDPAGFASTLGWKQGEGVLVQRAGERYFEPPRHYAMGFYNGRKPPSYLAHDQLGGNVLCLGSWWDQVAPLLIRLPLLAPGQPPLDETVDLSRDRVDPPWEFIVTGPPRGNEIASGRLWARVPDATIMLKRDLQLPVQTNTLALRFRGSLPKSRGPLGHRVELSAANGARFVAGCEMATADTGALRLMVGDMAAPATRREIGASYGDFDFVLLVRDGEIRFRAIAVTSGLPLFEERTAVAGLRIASVTQLRMSAFSEQSADVWITNIALSSEN